MSVNNAGSYNLHQQKRAIEQRLTADLFREPPVVPEQTYITLYMSGSHGFVPLTRSTGCSATDALIQRHSTPGKYILINQRTGQGTKFSVTKVTRPSVDIREVTDF